MNMKTEPTALAAGLEPAANVCVKPEATAFGSRCFGVSRSKSKVVATFATLILTIASYCGAAEPILQWRFDGESQPGAWQGKFGTPADGPRTPRYPGFSAENRGATFVGHEGWILV
ncbi:MAG: hypothetical protein KDB05_32255, partial [Planctomycetales bacterium]|nr:hypothetical protein [Planctomycetales bacterium]